MKLRCVTNSIRLRLRKSELEKLKNNQTVFEILEFGNQVIFRFALEISDTNQISAQYLDNQLTVSLPNKEAAHWMNSNQVSLEHKIPIEVNKSLHVLIEKDFPCIDRNEENYNDTFFELSDNLEKAKKC